MLAVLRNQAATCSLVFLISGGVAGARPSGAPLTRGMAPTSGEAKELPQDAPRALWRREVFQAIQNGLARRGIRAGGNLRPEDLRIQSLLPVSREDLGLEIKRISFDPIRRETVFDLWASKEPQFLPFEVRTRRDPQSLGLTQISDLDLGKVVRPSKEPLQGTSGQGVIQARTNPAVVAKPGRPATLVISGENMRIITTVIPLQPGSKGQSIRVRDPATARIMTAEVVDEGLLRARF